MYLGLFSADHKLSPNMAIYMDALSSGFVHASGVNFISCKVQIKYTDQINAIDTTWAYKLKACFGCCL